MSVKCPFCKRLIDDNLKTCPKCKQDIEYINSLVQRSKQNDAEAMYELGNVYDDYINSLENKFTEEYEYLFAYGLYCYVNAYKGNYVKAKDKLLEYFPLVKELKEKYVKIGEKSGTKNLIYGAYFFISQLKRSEDKETLNETIDSSNSKIIAKINSYINDLDTSKSVSELKDIIKNIEYEIKSNYVDANELKNYNRYIAVKKYVDTGVNALSDFGNRIEKFDLKNFKGEELTKEIDALKFEAQKYYPSEIPHYIKYLKISNLTLFEDREPLYYISNDEHKNTIEFVYFAYYDLGEKDEDGLRLYFYVDKYSNDTKFCKWPNENLFSDYVLALKRIRELDINVRNAKNQYQTDIKKDIEEIKDVLKKSNIESDYTGNKEKDMVIEKSYLKKVRAYLADEEKNGIEKLIKKRNEKLKEIEEANVIYKEELEEFGGSFNPFGYYNRLKTLNSQVDDICNQINSYETSVKRKRLEQQKKEPYYARIDLSVNEDKAYKFYLGAYGIDNYVIPTFGSNYIIGKIYNNYMLYANSGIDIRVIRKFKINNENIDFLDITSFNSTSMIDSELFDLYNDEKTNETHDILQSIAAIQYQIVIHNEHENIVVNGVAGSGKTMILIYRIQFILSRVSSVDYKDIWIISPSKLLMNMNADFMNMKELATINNDTYLNIIQNIIKAYCKHNDLIFGFDFKGFENISYEALKYYTPKYVEQFRKCLNSTSKQKEFSSWLIVYVNDILKRYKLNEINFTNDNKLEDPIANNLNKHLPYTEKGSQSGFFTDFDLNDIIEAVNEKRYHHEQSIDIEKYMFVLETLLKKNESGATLKDNAKFLSDNKTLERLLALFVASAITDAYNLSKFDKLYFLYVRFVMEGFKLKNYLDPKAICDFEICYYLKALQDKFGVNNGITSEQFFFVDEYQNYSCFELELILSSFKNVHINLFGDISQAMTSRGIKDVKKELNNVYFKEYELMENYRNAYEITLHTSKELKLYMFPIGRHGELNLIDNLDDVVINGRTAIIYKTEDAKNFILAKFGESINDTRENPNIVNDKINMIWISDAKGIEVETAYIIDEGLTDKEKYVAYTRAKERLFIFETTTSYLRRKVKI